MDTSQTEDHGISVELEALQAIYINELEVTRCPDTNVPINVSINLHPSTADNANEQYVRLTLSIKLSSDYPNEIPEIAIRSPRGLSDKDLERISSDLKERAQQNKGTPMLFELIEIAKEHLTLGNTPSCVCTICLYGFNNDDVFTKTDCYHYFHSHCLKRFIESSLSNEKPNDQPSFKEPLPEAKVLCPVCREPFNYDMVSLEAPPPIQSETAPLFKVDEEMIKLQSHMAQLFLHQKSRGGIIDIEEEKNKFLIEISSVPSNLDIGLHVNRPGFANNVTNVSKKVNSRTKNPKTQYGQGMNSSSSVTRNSAKNFPSSGTRSRDEFSEKTTPKNVVREDVSKTSSSSSQVKNDSKDAQPTHSQSDDGGRSANHSGGGGRRRNYRRTYAEKYTDDPRRNRFDNSKPFNSKYEQNHKAEPAAGLEDDKKNSLNQNGFQHSQSQSNGASSRRRGNFNGGDRPRNSGDNNRYKGNNQKQRSFQDKELADSTSTKNCSHEAQVKSEKFSENVCNSPPNWVQPVVVTGPPKMAFNGGPHTINQPKNSAFRPPPGFDTKVRSGPGFVNMLPPARFQSLRPPPGFKQGSSGDS